MAEKKDVSAFARKWLERFKDPAISAATLTGRPLGDDCAQMGFRMDYGLSFSAKYGKAAEDGEALEKIIADVEDISLLGSAVYSRWRYFNSLVFSAEEILEPKNRAWFTLALGRLAALAGEDDCSRGAVPKKICVEVEQALPRQWIGEKRKGQKLLLDAGGNLFFSTYVFRSLGPHKPTGERAFCIEKTAAEKLLCGFACCLADIPEDRRAPSSDKWKAELTDEKGKCHRYEGPLESDREEAGTGFSDLLRSVLAVAFGSEKETGQTERVVLDFRYTAGEKQGEPYAESLTLDRKSETVEYVRHIGPGRTLTHRLQSVGQVGKLLDDLEAEHVFAGEGAAPRDPEGKTEYTLTLALKNGERRVFSGNYDRAGLPPKWAAFITAVKKRLLFYGVGAVFEPSVYGQARRKTGEILFCSVEFQASGKRYFYISDDESIGVGDEVIVPVGKEGRCAIAEVVKTELYTAETAPLPVERTKHILGRNTPENVNLFCFHEIDE